MRQFHLDKFRFKQLQVTSWNAGLDWNWSNDSTIAVPSYTDIKAQVDSWLTSLTFEKDTITFEKGSFVGPEDNIVLSIVEGEEIPHDLRLRETNNDWGSSNQSYGIQELYFLWSRIVCFR